MEMETAKGIAGSVREGGRGLRLFSALAFSLSSQALMNDVLSAVTTRVRNASE
jgi:hypothetical protein